MFASVRFFCDTILMSAKVFASVKTVCNLYMDMDANMDKDICDLWIPLQESTVMQERPKHNERKKKISAL